MPCRSSSVLQPADDSVSPSPFLKAVERYDSLNNNVVSILGMGLATPRFWGGGRGVSMKYYYCIVLYLYIYIALLEVHTSQKRFQCERPREKRAVLRERKEASGTYII